MSLWRKFTYLLPWVRRAEDRDIQEELLSLQQFAQPADLGNVTLAAEDARGELSWLWLERLVQDIRYALRSMAHYKAFTFLVVSSLALGIGANTAIYSFMDGILLRPLPVRDPHALVIMKWRAKDYALATSGMMWSTNGSSFDPATGTLSSIFPYGALQVFDGADDVVESAFGYTSASRLALSAHDQTVPVKGQYVTGRYFTGMGVAAVAGRLITDADDVVGAPPVAVLSQRYSHRFGSPQGAVGQTVRINDKPFFVIGVVPSAFFGAEPGAIPDVYVPMRADEILETGFPGKKYSDDHLYWLEVMARLKPGVSVEQAQTALAPRFRQFAESTVTADKQKEDLPALVLQSGATGLDSLRRQYSQPIYVLTAMVGLILLIACSNIANLMLARAVSRRREIAVRLSIGASRARVVRQLLTESVLLSTVGGALGIAVGWWGIRVLTELLSNGRENFTLHAELNWTVLAMTLGLSTLTGLLFGLAPALQATRVDVAPALKEVRAGDAPRRRRALGFGLGHALVTAQIVFSLVLLVAAGLFGRTLSKLHAIELGFERENVLLLTIRPGSIGYKGADLFQLYERVRADLGSLPGVRGVSLSSGALPMGGGTLGPVGIVGAESVSGTSQPARAALASVGPGFFTTMGIPLVGRDLNDRDSTGAKPVVVVNRRLAKMFGIENPIGRTMTMVKDQFEIVGVAEDALTFTLKEERRPVAYFSYLQASRAPYGMVFEIRTAGNPLALAGAARQVVRHIDSRIAVHDVKTQAAHIDQAISSEITLARLCSAFAALALLIACVGLYGMVAFNVTRRTNEIGIRMTLGARRPAIVWMVLHDVLVMTVVGLAIGVPIALAGSRYVRSLLYGIEPTDPTALFIGIAALVLCGLAAAALPAHRASRIDPMVAVRHE
jgi:macrolide transport system ATP-binding/permease protein